MNAFLKIFFGHKGRNELESKKEEGRSKKCGGGVPPAPSCPTTKLQNHPTTKLPNHQTVKLSNHQTIQPSNRHQAAGSAEEVKMNAMHNALNAMQNAQCTMHNSGMKTGAQGRRKARLGWAAAVVVAAAGVLLAGARDAWADAGDTSYWKNNTSYTNWNAEAWYNTTRSWDNHNPNYCGHQRLFFDNDNQLKTYNNFSGDGLAFWQLIYTNGVTKTHTAYGSASTAAIFYDWSGTNPKIENYVSTEQRVLFLCQIGAGKTLEVNPVGGDLSLSKVYAAGQIMNVYGDHKLTINDWYAGTNSANAPSTIYVANAAHVVVTNWRAGTSSSHPLQTVNVVNSGGQVDIQQVSGLSHWVKQGSGKMVYGGNAGTAGDAAYITAEAGTLIVSNFTAVASEVTATNMTLTNSATLVMKSPASFRRVSIAQNSVVEMDVLSNSEAAHLGVVPSSENSQHQFNCLDGSHTLKLKYTTGFDPTADADWIVYVGRRKSASGGSMSATETGRITVDKSDLVSHGATGTFSDPTLCPNSNGAANTAIKITYTALKQQAAVGLSQTTFTYNGGTITLTPNGGSGTGAYSIAKVSGGTGTGTFNASTKVLTVTAAGTFLFDVTRAASGAYAARTDRVTVTVNKGTQAAVTLSTTTFTYAGSSFTLSGSGGSSGGSYSYVYDADGTGSGSVSNGKLTATAAGTMTVNVTCAGNNLWNSRTDTVTVTVNKGTQAAVTLSTTTFTYAGSGFTLSGSGGTAGSYSYAYGSNGTGSGSVSGSTLTPTAAGTMTVNVTRSGNDLYNARTDTVTVTVNKGTQAAVGLATTTFAYSPSGLTLTGNGGTAGSYSYAYGANGTGSGSVAGSTLSVTAVGTMTVNVTRNGNNLYNSRTDTVTVTVNKGSQTVEFTASPLMVTAGKGTSVAAEVTSPASGGGAVTFSGNAAGVATVTSGGAVTGVAAGQVTITATAAATAFYESATATYVLTVRMASPTTSGSIDSVTAIGSDTFTVTYTRGNGYYAVLLAREGNAPTAPSDGTGAATVTGTTVVWSSGAVQYPQGNTDGTKAIQHANAASKTITVTGASPATEYHLALYSRNNNQTAASAYTNFSYSATPATRTFWTLSTQPSGAPSVNTVSPGSSSAPLSWSKGAGSGYTLVVVAPKGTAVTPPTDGTTYTVGYTGLGGVVVSVDGGTSATATALTPETEYTVHAFAYAMGADGATANYNETPDTEDFETGVSNGPKVWATGVTEDGFLFNWLSQSAAATGFDLDTGSGAPVALLDEGFTQAEGWATASTNSSGEKTAASGKWTQTYCGIQATTADGTSCAYPAYGRSTGALEFPAITGTVTKVKAYLGATDNSTGTEKGLKLQSYNGSSWTDLQTFSGTFSSSSDKKWFTYTPATPIAANGLRLRLLHLNNNTVYIYHILVEGSAVTGVKGSSRWIGGLTSGNTYTVKVRKNPGGEGCDWSDDLSVKAGVVPDDIDSDGVRDSVTFTWTDTESGAVGYKVDATTEEPASATVVYSCPTNNGLGTNQWSNGANWLEWEYEGTASTESVTSSYITKGPGFVGNNSLCKGHYLIGRAGQAVVSTNFDLEGATAAVLTFDNCAWNAANSSKSIEASRLDAYYRLDGTNEWNYFATCIATNAGDTNWVSQSMALPAGALDGNTLAVKIVAPNAEYYNSAIRGAGVRNIKLTLEMAAGRYGPGHSLEGYPKTISTPASHTVSGLSPNTKVYFRVQALQGGTANPTAKSIWIEGEGETSGFPGPALLAADPIERHAFTANWTADAAATGGYQIEWTRCGGGAADTTVSTCNNGTLTVGGDSGWRYIRPAGSGYPKWAKGSANTTVGHNMIVGVSPANPSPAVASPDMNFSGYTGGYVEFSHWSRHATLYSPDAQVTLWYRTSADGSSWGAWTVGETTANLTSGGTIVTEQLPIPAGAAGQAHVQIKLSTEHSLPANGGHASIVVDGDSTYTGPMIKDIVVHGTSSGTPDYDTCAEGRSGIQNVAAGTTQQEFTGLAAGTPYYYHVRSVVSGSPTTYSDWSEGQVTTLAPLSPPDEVWAENIRQNHMTVAWSEAEGANAATLYKYQVSGCDPSSSPTVTAVSESPTNAELTVDAEWSYIGGGTLVGAETVTVGGSTIAKLSEENFVESTRECYPVWAGNKNSHPEHSLVLAGTNSPGLESAEFSTVGATAGSVSFGHGRWYAQDSTQGAATVLKLYYSIDGGDSWTLFQTTPNVYNKDYAYNNVVTYSLPAAALGHAHAKVRLVAEAATVAATTSGGSTYHALGAAVTAAKVTLTKPTGNYTGGGCVIASGEGLTADQLSAELSGLTANSTYYFRVAASDGVLVGGSAQYGAWVESMAKTLAVPAAPASAWVVPESIGRHSMTIQWDVAEGAETYEVLVYKGSNASGTLKQTLTTDGTTLMVSGLEAQTQYYFTVRAKADNEQSSSTANCTGTTSDALKITGFCVTNILENTLTVKWDDEDAAYTLEVGSTSTSGSSEPVYETIACPATTLARSDAGNGWFYLGGNANYPKYYVKSSGTAAEKAADQGHVLSYSSGGTPGIQSRWFSTYGAKSAAVEFLHGRWYNGGANSALRVMYSIDGGTTWTSAGDIPASNESVPGGSSKTVTRLELPARALGQRSVAIRLLAPNATSGGSYGYGAEVKDLTIKIESYPNAANVFSGSVDDGSKNLSGLTAGQRYWFRLTASETFEGTTYTATAEQTAATRKKTTGVVQSQGFEGSGGALDTTAWGYDVKYFTVGSTTPHAWASGDPKVEVADGENPLYGDKALRMSGSASAGVFGVAEFRNKTFSSTEKIAVTIPFAARGLSSGENLWVSYSVNGGSTWLAPAGLETAGSGTWIRGKIATGGSDVINQNWPYNHGTNETTRPAGDAYTFELDGVSQIAVRVAFCGNSGGANHYYYIDEVKLERLAQKPKDATATANSQGTVDLAWTPADGQSVVIIRGQDKRYPPSSVDLDSLPHGYEVVKTPAGGNYWVNTASSVPALSKTAEDTGVTGGWKYFYYFYGALDNGDGTYSLSRDCLQREAIVKGMVEAIASQGWDGWDVHPWGYKKGRTTNPGQAGDCGYWAYNQSGATLPYKWAHFVENSWEYDGDARVEPTGVSTYASWYGSGCTYGPAGRNDPDRTNQLGVSSFTNYFGTNCFRLSGGSGWVWSGEHTYTNNNGNVRTVTNPYINTNNAAIQFDTVDLSGYKNVEFSFHYAQTYSGGGNYMHVAISTNGNGENGSWMAYDNKDPSGWRQVDSSRDYGLQLQTMTEDQTDGSVNFYDESRAPYGNPFVLQVPDSVTQMTVRLTFFDTTGKDQRKALVFVDEVRLTGEVAIEAPKPYISEIGKDRFMVHWAAVEDATTYDVQVTEECDEEVVKLQQAFPVNALPKGWTKSDSGVTFTKSASRLYSGATGDHDFGLDLSGGSGALTSPEVGGTTNLHFYAKAYNASGSAKLIVEAKGDKDTAWEEVGTWTAAQLTGSWKGYTNSLPNRQWTQVRFRREGGSGSSDSIYVDDITIHGTGVYTDAEKVKLDVTGVSATNQAVTGLTSGKRYLAHVRAVGAPAGVVVRSAWGETADWTSGDFQALADGYEMTHLTWAAAGDGMVVVAVDKGTDPSAVKAPTNTLANYQTLAGTYGAFDEGRSTGAHVIWAGTTAQTAPGKEFVSPYDEDHPAADFVVYWKRGSYWEGRLATNVALGTYMCAAADAFAVTNGTALTAGAQGAGWDGNWQAWEDGSSYISVIDGSLIGSNKLAGAGGNMVRFTMEDGARYLRIYRPLETALSSSEVWIMATFRSRYGMDPSNPNESKTLAVQLSDAKDNPSGGVYAGDDTHVFAQFGRLADTDRHMKIWNSAGNTASTYTLDDWGHGSGSGIYTMVAKYTRGDGNLRVKVYYEGGTGTISGGDGVLRPTAPEPANAAFDAVRNVGTHNVASIFLMGSGYHGYLDFDEVRVGTSWADIVGKETEAPFPVTSAKVWTDGNELVRINWTYADEGTDTSVTPNLERPLAAGVRVIAKTGTGAWTAEELELAAHPAGTTAGDAVVIYEGKGTNEAAVAAGGISRWDHVVAPGSTHRYAVAAYTGGKNAAAVEAVDRDNAGVYTETTGLYGETEYVNPFAYTNWATWSSESGRRWTGGNGFGANYWSVPDGSAGTWSLATPEEAQSAVHITNGVHGSRMAAGNVMKVVVGDVETASINRTLDGDAWYGKGGQTFYVAFRMAYQWDDKAGRQVGLRLTDDTGKYVQFGKARGDDSGYQHRFGVTASPNGTGYTSGWSTSGDDMNGYGNASGADYVNNAYLVVGKVNWSADGKANLRGVKYLIGNNGNLATLPGEEKDVSWEASYDNAGIGAIRKIELIAGTEGSGNGTIGTAWFDEIRFGPTWEDIVGATEPQDTWVEGLGVETADATYRYLGDYVRWYMWGWPKGPKQSAWVTLATDTTFATVLATNGTSWVENTVDGRAPAGSEQTKWQGGEVQFTRIGYLYAGGSVKGELVTLNSWQRPAPHDAGGHKWNKYDVLRLPVPTVDSAVGGTARATLRWTQATENSRTFTEVMVVRYTGDGAAPAPVQGTTYLKGQSIGTGKVVYRGTDTSLVDKGLTKSTTYHYLFFTVNNSYYSAAATADATTDANDPEIVIDGDPTDWVGEPSETKNSSTLSSGEWIWTDKVLDGRVDKPAAYDADMTEFRMKVDNNGYVNFMVRLHCLTNKQNPYISVGIVTNVDATQLAVTGNEDGENWIGDESATFMGGNLFSPASLHYADIQMAVHWVTTAGEDGAATGSGGWVVELYKKDRNSWYAPVVAWEAESSANLAEDPCIEWKVKRSDLGLDYANVTPARFTVASFANGGGWNNDTEATVDLSSGKSHAVDTLAIAPWGVDDKNLSLSAWDEGIKDGNAEYWFDIWFGPSALHNAAPNAPATYTLDGAPAENGQIVTASPTMRWSACTDHDDIGGTHGDLGFVVGYLVEVSTNEYFNGLEGTTENGPISCRVNIKSVDGEAMMGYRYKTDSRYYWWRVRARDNSGALSAPTPWNYEVTGKTDNEGPVARLLFVGKDDEVAQYVSNASFRHEQDMSGDGKSVLDSDLEDGGHTFGFVIEWYDVNGVFATNQLRSWKEGDGEGVWPSSSIYPNSPWNARTGGRPNAGDFAWNIQSHHGDGTPYGRVSPNWDLIIVDRSTVSHENPASRPAQPAAETVGGVSRAYTWTNAMVLPTDDGGTETIWGWIIDCGLDHVFQPSEMINDGNDGQYITNHVQGAFSIGRYRTDLDIYLTVSAEDGCRSGPYAETADYDWPLYAENGSTGSYQSQSGQAGYQQSGFCAMAPNPSRNVTTNQLLHIHVRDNDMEPPVTSQAKWRADATGAGGKVLLPMMAVTSGGAANAPGSWDPTWDNLAAQGRVPTQDGQGKALEWQLTDGDVSTYTQPSTSGGTGAQAWKGSANPIRLFFNVYDEYLHSGLASFTAYSARPTASVPAASPTKTDGAAVTGSYTSQANNTRSLYNSLLMLGTDTNSAGYKPAWSKITQYPWEEVGSANTHGWGTGPDTVLAWQLDASEYTVTNLLGRRNILTALGTGTDGDGVQIAFTNDVKLLAWDNDNNADGDQLAAELTFGRMLFSDDDATPPEMASFTSAGTGTNFTHFGRLGEWTFGDSSEGPVFTATPLMSAITLSNEVALHQYDTRTDPTRHWNSSSHTIYYDGAGGRATDWNQTGAPFFEFALKGDGNTIWNADMIGFENRVAQAGPTLYALTVQAPTLSLVNNAVADGAINTADDWTGDNVTEIATYNGKEAIKLLTTTGIVTFGPQACAQLTGLTVEAQVAAFSSLDSTKDRKLKIQYKATGDADWTDLPGGSYTVSSFAEVGYGVYLPFSYDLANIPGLLGSGKDVQIRVYGTDLGAGTGQGYAVAGLKVTVSRGDAMETLLGRMVIEKELDESGGHFKTETVTSVIFGFDRPVQCSTTNEHFFRLYAFDATRYNSDGVLEHLSDMPSDGGWTFTWGIKNLFLHGTASEPKKDEVTDYDVAEGAWTNRMEVMDGAMAGYDTERSGLRVYDAVDGSGNRTEYSGEAPSFRILYPQAYSTSPKGLASSGELLMRSVSEATFNNLSDPEFDVGSPTWTLSASGATVAGGKLTLASEASAYAKQTVALDAMSGVKSATVAGTVRAKGAKTSDEGGVNTLTVTAKVYSKAVPPVLMKTLTENLTLTARPKNYPVGPWALDYDNVGSVEFTVGQTDATSTELVVESLSGYVAQWGDDITEDDAEWSTTVVNGMEAAKMLVRTPELDLTSTAMPLSSNLTGTTAQKMYTLEATIHDYDGDRAGDALATTATTNFWLWDDDDVVPQWGAKFDSPMGIFMNGSLISLKARRNSGADQIWPILDCDLTALAPNAEVLFSLSAYDYSGWKTTAFSVGSETVQSGDSVASGWSQTASEGAPDSPAATNTWSITAKNLYTAHRTDFTVAAGVEAALTANVTDLDNDRLDDSRATGASRVGYAWFADQDVSAPGWGSQTTPYYGLMISTGVGASAGLADLLGTEVSPAPYALGGAANNQGEFAGRSYTVYDGQLKAAGAEGANQFVITANLNDPLPTDAGARARRPTGLKRGSTLTESAAMWGDSSVAANVFTVTNTHLVLQTPWTGGAGSLTNVAFSEALTDPAIGKTRINTQAGHTSWAWTFPTNDIGKLLPPSETVAALTLKVQAYDADANRHEDQKHAELVGPTITLRDDDTVRPGEISDVKLVKDGTETDVPAEVTRENAVWYNAANIGQWAVKFTKAVDGPKGANDNEVAGVADNGYKMMLRTVDHTTAQDTAWQAEGVVLKALNITASGDTRTASLESSTGLTQGLTTQLVFAVDSDCDRPGDQLASAGVAVPLAYDTTMPSTVKLGASSDGSKAHDEGANPDTADDPTTQFDLTWYAGDVGPDGSDHGNDGIYSPWETYKVYYREYNHQDVISHTPSGKTTEDYIWQEYLGSGSKAVLTAENGWTNVTKNTEITDPSAGGTAEVPAKYTTLGSVRNTAGSSTNGVRLYDLDFDREYIVVVVGVDKAGNEGPFGQQSWATNNTFKFAVTQGVIRTSFQINSNLPTAGTAAYTNIGMARITGTNVTKAAVLYWLAAGQDAKTGTFKPGGVTKQYDLIYRDAASFNELGNETWYMAGSAASTNSGTSKTNWNYQVDPDLDKPNRLRFYRASYHDRWQDTKPGSSEKQYPLASEEVYSMNNIVLSEGFNYVSLQGVPWTNTFEGVFGTDSDMWPSGISATDTNSTQVHFFTATNRELVAEWYFFGGDGEWYDSNMNKVTTNNQAAGFFMRPFSINLPNGEDDEGNPHPWWKTHDEGLGATYGSRSVKSMMWHPIMQVPTNAPAGGFSHTVKRGEGMYNTLSLNLPVSVHPSNLCLVAFDDSTPPKPTNAKMQTGIGPWAADQLYVIDSATKEVRGDATMYCDANGEWRYAKGTYPNYPKVTGTPIRPNDILVLISCGGEGTWTWTYTPEQFYTPPNRHMGRKPDEKP